MGIQEYLQEATGKGASDLFIVAGLPLTYKINRKMIRMGDRLMPEDTILTSPANKASLPPE